MLNKPGEYIQPPLFTDKQWRTPRFPLGLSIPEGMPVDGRLPTLLETERADIKVGEMIVEFREADRDKFGRLGDLSRTVVNI